MRSFKDTARPNQVFDGARRRIIRHSMVAGGSAVAVAFLVAFSSSALGRTFNSTNHTAPYHRATYSVSNILQTGCTTKTRLGVFPHWNNATGIGGWTALSTTKSCPQYLGGKAEG